MSMNPLLLLIPVGIFLAASKSSAKASKKEASKEPLPPTPTDATTPPSSGLPELPPGAEINKGVDLSYGEFGNLAGVQAALIDLGHDLGRSGADGVMGPKTKAAIQLFQAMAKDLYGLGPFELRQDGGLDNTTINVLWSAVADASQGGWPTPEEWLAGGEVPSPEGTDPGATDQQAEATGMAQVERDNADIALDEWFVKRRQTDLYEIALCGGVLKTPTIVNTKTELTGGTVLDITTVEEDISQWLANVTYWLTYVGLEGDCREEGAPVDFALPFSPLWAAQAKYRDAWMRIYEYIKAQMAENGWQDDKLPTP